MKNEKTNTTQNQTHPGRVQIHLTSSTGKEEADEEQDRFSTACEPLDTACPAHAYTLQGLACWGYPSAEGITTRQGPDKAFLGFERDNRKKTHAPKRVSTTPETVQSKRTWSKKGNRKQRPFDGQGSALLLLHTATAIHAGAQVGFLFLLTTFMRTPQAY